jgi:hypothetical protein
MPFARASDQPDKSPPELKSDVSEKLMPDMRFEKCQYTIPNANDHDDDIREAAVRIADEAGRRQAAEAGTPGSFEAVRRATEVSYLATLLTAARNLPPTDKPGTDPFPSDDLQAIIKSEFVKSGTEAADSLAKDITKELPKNMTLEIRQDKDFEKRVKSNASPLEIIPEYLRVIELKEDGKSLGVLYFGLHHPGPPAKATP